MSKYDNEFDENIANCPWEPTYAKQRECIIRIIDHYRQTDNCSFFRVFKSEASDIDYKIFYLFVVFDEIYIYFEIFENGLAEGSQLEKVYDEKGKAAIVMFSNDPNARSCAETILLLLREKALYTINTPLDK